MRGKKVVLKGLHITKAKGRQYVYAWRGGPRLTAPIGTPEFVKQYNDAIESRKAMPVGDTVAGLILEYQSSRAFKSLAISTRNDHERAFPHILKAFGNAPLGAFSDARIRRDIRKWHSAFEHDRQADKILGSLSRLLSFAVEDGYLSVNPALSIVNRYHREPDPTPVSERSLTVVLNAETTPIAVSRAIELMARSGLARVDAVSLTWSHVKSDRISKRRVKSRQRARIPMTPELIAALERCQKSKGTLTVLNDDSGRPWTADRLGKQISKAFRAVGLDHTSHDLRATFTCLIMRKGATDEEVAEALGWTDSLRTIAKVRRHYVDDESIFIGRIAKFGGGTS